MLHEPFRKYSGPDTCNFNEDLDEVLARADILKHHPGNLLSDRQNRLLYEAWVESGGSIVHLRRSDTRAQALSLTIARALNSFHRPHRVTDVPRERLLAEQADLEAEIAHQSQLLVDVPHIGATYEDLYIGEPARRMRAIEHLLHHLAPGLRRRLRGDTDVRAEVMGLLADDKRVSARPSGERVKMIERVPSFRGSVPLLDPDCASLVAARAESSLDEIEPFGHGVRWVPASELFGRGEADRVVAAAASALRSQASIRCEANASQLGVVAYDGDTWPDHDLDLWPGLVNTRTSAVHFAVALTRPALYTGGTIHLAGRGYQEESRAHGSLFYFASGIGARRSAVESGPLCSLVGSLPLLPGQILAPGQLIDTDHLFVQPRGHAGQA